MIAYIFHSTIVWTVLLILYLSIFRRLTFFGINRLYLILALLSGLVIPLIKLPVNQNPVYSFIMEPIVFLEAGNTILNDISYSNIGPGLIWTSIAVIYAIVFILAIIRFAAGLNNIYQLYTENEVQKEKDHVRIIVANDLAPFSFLNFFFISRKLWFSSYYDTIKAHELVHIRQKHSWDRLFAEIMKIIFWFNPVIYLYRNAISANHEFLADEMASGDRKKAYSNLLVQTAGLRSDKLPVNSFIYSPVKNRIKMIYKNRSKPFYRAIYLFALPLVIILAMMVATTKSSGQFNLFSEANAVVLTDTLPPPPPPPPIPPPPPPSTADNEIFSVAEQMPRFPGCENLPSIEEKEKCSQQKLMEYIFNNLKYPKEAKENITEGRVVIRFVVMADGRISDVEILRDIGSGCGEAARQVIESMNDLPERWMPGKQGGRTINTYFTLPVIFKLAEENKQE